ncbi:MAG: 4Fe-4S dicluster domain-containing protein [Clostridia bacterium]|nr:MAG: 4Fe-4S dicluster domain-containing protein [Clostridia bacterium]
MATYRVRAMDAEWLWENVRCALACPVHTEAGRYVSLIAQGRFAEALEVAREPNPLVHVCGRICAHPCETHCRRGQIDAPVAIRALKRAAAEMGCRGPLVSGPGTMSGNRDGGGSVTGGRLPAGGHAGGAGEGLATGRQPAHLRPGPGKKVAVVGAGPAGLACAHDLALLGYRVTIFEAQPRPGGMLRLGIPAYRLPRAALDEDIEAILALGVRLETGKALGRDFSISDLRANYGAVFLAVGATASRELQVPGADLDGVLKGVDFLLNVNLSYRVEVGERVIVIGGGNVAVDVARSALRLPQPEAGEWRETLLTTAADAARAALRLGARRVEMVCLESRESMPAFAEEVEAAAAEGITIRPSLGPHAILGEKGRVKALVTRRVASLFDAAGRFNPQFIPGSEETWPADTVILAIGQTLDTSMFSPADGPALTPRQTIQVDPETMATNLPGVFTGGDAAFGPRIAIAAIADGRLAARSIDAYLRGVARTTAMGAAGRITPPRRLEDDYHRLPRQPVPSLQLDRRVGIAEVEVGYSREQAMREARRCLQCYLNPWLDPEKCLMCGGCVDVCPYNCLRLVPLDRVVLDEKLRQEVAWKLGVPPDWPDGYALRPQAGQAWAVMLKDEDKCIRCGLCVRRCPAGAMRMVEFSFWGSS